MGQDIEENGVWQGAAVRFLQKVRDTVNELRTDHATGKTSNDNLNDYLDFVNEADGVIGGDFVISAGAATTLTGAGNIKYRIGGEIHYIALDTTITLGDDGDVDADKWRAWRIEIDRLGVVTATADGDTQHVNEQDALLNLASIAQTANTVTIGYFTIDSNGGFNIGTDNVNGETAENVYHVRGAQKQASGLHTALGSTIVADATAATWSSGTVDAKRNGVRVAQIAAITNQAMDDADTITTLKYGGWLLVVDLAGTGIYALAADGIAGTVSAMAYASAALAEADLATLCDQLPELFVPIGKLVVANLAGGTFTAGTTNWDATSVTTTVTNCTVGVWDKDNKTGFDTHKINPPTLTDPPATLSNADLSLINQ